MASGGRTRNFKFILSGSEPNYFKEAYDNIGINEDRDKDTVEEFIKDVIGKKMNASSTPWCAFFVGSMLERNSYKSSKSGMARSYVHYGLEVSEENTQVGDIVVLWRGRHDDGVLGHIGFFVGWTPSGVLLLGGNQGDKVCIQEFSKEKILAIRRPKKISQSRTVKATAAEVVNSGVLKPAAEALPDPKPEILEKVNSTIEQATPMLESLGEIKPYIKIALYTLSALTLLAIFYYRLQDFNQKGRA